MHTRHHRSILAAAEKRTLIWIAGRLPLAINSDHLSALGLSSMFVAGAAFAGFRVTRWAAVAVVVSLVVNWFGDSLDGTVARVRGHERPRYGFYVDHVIDIAGTAALFAGLGASGLMHPALAAVLLAAYLLVCSETYLATHTVGVFRMSFLGFGPTELRILLAVGAMRAFSHPNATLPLVGRVRLFDLGAAISIVGLMLVFVVSVIRNTRGLYAAEPLPTAEQRSVAVDAIDGANRNALSFQTPSHRGSQS
jgi:archaetidylinositol phosphate synthase